MVSVHVVNKNIDINNKHAKDSEHQALRKQPYMYAFDNVHF